MNYPDLSKLGQLSSSYPRKSLNVSYGTAGFRGRAETLDFIMFRMGLLAVLRSKAKQGKAIGIMVTASHNPVQDNGIKLVDPLGEMLEQSWEVYATRLVSFEDSKLAEGLLEIAQEANVDWSIQASVILAKDTRPSSDTLCEAVKDGIEALQGQLTDFGLLTTPQLHYMVCCTNTQGGYGEPTEEGYYDKLSKAFLKIRQLVCISSSPNPVTIKVDGANGVGGLKAKVLQKSLKNSLLLSVCNDGSEGVLNEQCGADFVKTKQKPPNGLNLNIGDRCLSFDGDADRIVYFYKDEAGLFHLLDGDKIAALIASYIKEKLDFVGINLKKGLGVVQTAYANGSSTRYLQEVLKVPVAITKTGVKYLHHRAADYDVGVYFEANGHGTVLFSKDAENEIRKSQQNLSDDQKKVLEILIAFIDLTNQTVGDAISIMLLIETVLHEKQMTCADWDKNYTDLPNRLNKVSVKDRRVITTNDDETRVTQPMELQNKIDELVGNWSRARSFVRPSGTEDVVRVYAESETQIITENLSAQVSRLVYDICDGVGERPDVPPLVE